MDKLKTRVLLISLVLVLLVSLQGVSAVTDDNGNLTSESIDLSICDNTGDAIPEKLSNSPDDVISASDDLDVLGEDSSTYSLLNNEIVNGGNVVELQHGHYTYDYGSTISVFGNNRIIDGRGAVIDMAGSDIRAFNVFGSGVTIKNLTIQNVNNPAAAGAIGFYASGSVTNCNFIGNNAGGIGGAVFFLDNCEGAVANCNFIGNSAGGAGGAIRMYSGSVTNCTFVNNTANDWGGGAIFFSKEGHVTNCTFTDNKATGDECCGGAVYFDEGATGEIINCNFTNNTASVNGGAVYFFHTGKVTNCNFTNNNADKTGGAINMLSGTVMNCNFTNNNAFDSGAVSVHTGEVTNCNFVGNKATGDEGYGGGAIHMNSGSVENCNFTNNNAFDGGAILFGVAGNVTNCNFTGNNATTGSAIYFYSASATKTVSNSRFLNNRANAETLEVTKNDNNITITFTGKDNLLNAIYSNGDVSFTNVTYWGANVIANTGSSPTTPTRSNKEVGQNITVSVVVNDELVLSEVKATDENGMIVLHISAGENYFICARHETDSYYTEAETINSTMKFSVNVTSQTTGNKTVNLTAKSNIPNEVIDGKLLFIVPSSDPINATYAGNGTWWAVHTFDDYGVHEVNASYTGLDNVIINNGTVTISDVRLSVVKSANATEVAYNSTVQFTINITNYGSGDVTEVEVSDWLPKGLTFVEAGVINSTGQYEVFDSLDLLILIGDKDFVTFFEFGSGATIEDDGDNGDFAQWSITRIAGKKSVILLITARANGLVMGNITNEVTVKYHENKADRIVNSTNITVIPANSSVSAEDVEVTYGDAIVGAVSCENATGVSYKVIGVDGVVKEGTVKVGENITGLDLAAGKYSVNLTTAVLNGNYTSSNYTSKITVNPANSTVKAEDVEVTYGKAIVVAVTSENATGVSYKVIGVDGVVKEGTVKVGENITGLDLAAGDYAVNLTTLVNGNHSSSNYTSKIAVIPANSSVKAEDVKVTYGDAIVVAVTSVNATGVSYKISGIGGIVKEGTVSVGENITGLDLAVGDYTVNLTTAVNRNYTANSYTSRIAVIPANSSVKAEDVEVTYGDAIVVAVSSVNATGVSYKVIGADGIVKEGAVNVGENITGLDLAAGDYTVNLTTMVNGNYTANGYTSKIKVNRANSSISADDVEVTYGETVTVHVSVVNASEFYCDIVNENGTIVYSDILQAGLNVTVGNLSAGRYNVTLITGVDSNHTSVRNASKFTVNPAGSSVSAEDTVASFGDVVSIPVSSVNATGISYRIIDAKGKAVVNGTVKPGEAIGVSDLAAGNYTVSLTSVVDANHTSASNSSKLHIKHVVSIAISPVTSYAGEVVSFTAQFKYENGELVNEGTAGLTIKYEKRELLAASRYSILSADASVPVSNGKATFNVKVEKPGKYPYVISYSGGDADDVYAESTLTILKVNTTVSGVDISGKPADKRNVTVTVSGQDNNTVANGTVTLILNEKQYSAGVENGKAVLTVVLPNPGSYNATVTYNGNEYYNSSTSSISVDVKKVNTHAPSAEDVSGKAGEKTVIRVKFVDESGNPVKNGTATLTVDGKTYTAEVTNGVATFRDVVIPQRDTVADVYYQGNDYYNASSTTLSIKVKHDNNTEPDSNNTDEKHVSSNVVDGNATGNPIAMMLVALFVMVITYRKK